MSVPSGSLSKHSTSFSKPASTTGCKMAVSIGSSTKSKISSSFSCCGLFCCTRFSTRDLMLWFSFNACASNFSFSLNSLFSSIILRSFESIWSCKLLASSSRSLSSSFSAMTSASRFSVSLSLRASSASAAFVLLSSFVATFSSNKTGCWGWNLFWMRISLLSLSIAFSLSRSENPLSGLAGPAVGLNGQESLAAPSFWGDRIGNFPDFSRSNSWSSNIFAIRRPSIWRFFPRISSVNASIWLWSSNSSFCSSLILSSFLFMRVSWASSLILCKEFCSRALCNASSNSSISVLLVS